MSFRETVCVIAEAPLAAARPRPPAANAAIAAAAADPPFPPSPSLATTDLEPFHIDLDPNAPLGTTGDDDCEMISSASLDTIGLRFSRSGSLSHAPFSLAAWDRPPSPTPGP